MDEKNRQAAIQYGILEKAEALEKELLADRRIPSMGLDLSRFHDGARQIIIILEYGPPYSGRHKTGLIQDINSIARKHGLSPSGDAVRDYRQYFHFVFSCDSTWGPRKEYTLNRRINAHDHVIRLTEDEIGLIYETRRRERAQMDARRYVEEWLQENGIDESWMLPGDHEGQMEGKTWEMAGYFLDTLRDPDEAECRIWTEYTDRVMTEYIKEYLTDRILELYENGRIDNSAFTQAFPHITNMRKPGREAAKTVLLGYGWYNLSRFLYPYI